MVTTHGADAVTMDDVGVGKDTLFSQFDSRASLMMVLLEADERASQQTFLSDMFLFGALPLDPMRPYGSTSRVQTRADLLRPYPPRAVLLAANRDPLTRHVRAAAV